MASKLNTTLQRSWLWPMYGASVYPAPIRLTGPRPRGAGGAGSSTGTAEEPALNHPGGGFRERIKRSGVISSTASSSHVYTRAPLWWLPWRNHHKPPDIPLHSDGGSTAHCGFTLQATRPATQQETVYFLQRRAARNSLQNKNI
ncbi:hypothetical protein VZT92_009260 [Zoarces viviparus]|uniref:Uncharacterized protein n=1 Tax=Zoarces viviparus TaxID=48416 RepID=A0AAW1FHU2_ZOAVI